MKRFACINGVGNKQSISKHVAAVTITSAFNNEGFYSITAYILKRLTDYTPNRINLEWLHISGFYLADDDLLNRDPIDVIIGVDLYGKLLFGEI